MMSVASAAVCVMIRASEALSFRRSVSSFTASKSHGSDTRRPLTASRPSGVVSGNIWGGGGVTLREFGWKTQQLIFHKVVTRACGMSEYNSDHFLIAPADYSKLDSTSNLRSKTHPSSPSAALRAFNGLQTAKNSQDFSSRAGEHRALFQTCVRKSGSPWMNEPALILRK